jgi:tripeptide aminopeptidase
MTNVVEKFLRYIKIDTQSLLDQTTFPSTEKQFNLARLLVEELNQMGLQDVSLDENGYVMATLPANTDRSLPTLGLIAHVDTSQDFSGENVNPQKIKNYDGGEIVLNAEQNIILSPVEFPDLLDYIGEELITTDGKTLLGADDKAGVAEIMAAVEYLVNHPEIEHGKIRVGFTPDEEVGRGADRFDVQKFGADFGYTVDGGGIGELEFENFNAAMARVSIQGRGVHPGSAKDKMINAALVAIELNEMLPVNSRPEYTEGYEGFFHLWKLSAEVEHAEMIYLIRDHNRDLFEDKKRLLKLAADFLNEKYPQGTVTLKMQDQYFNMKEKILPVMQIIDTAKKAMLAVGVEPKVTPIRGGTDGARLSFMGLPCPNLFTGGHNFHGKYEYIPTRSMQKSVEVILKIIELYAQAEN